MIPGIRIFNWYFDCQNCDTHFEARWSCGAADECPDCRETVDPYSSDEGEWALPTAEVEGVVPNNNGEPWFLVQSSGGQYRVLVKDLSEHRGVPRGYAVRGEPVTVLGAVRVTPPSSPDITAVVIEGDSFDHAKWEPVAA